MLIKPLQCQCVETVKFIEFTCVLKMYSVYWKYQIISQPKILYCALDFQFERHLQTYNQELL